MNKTANVLPFGNKGWLWDSRMGAEGNLRGWGGLVGGTAGTLLGLPAGFLGSSALGVGGYKGLGYLGETVGRGLDALSGHKTTKREVDRRMTLLPTAGESMASGLSAAPLIGLKSLVAGRCPWLAALGPGFFYGGHNEKPMLEGLGLGKHAKMTKLAGIRKLGAVKLDGIRKLAQSVPTQQWRRSYETVGNAFEPTMSPPPAASQSGVGIKPQQKETPQRSALNWFRDDSASLPRTQPQTTTPQRSAMDWFSPGTVTAQQPNVSSAEDFMGSYVNPPADSSPQSSSSASTGEFAPDNLEWLQSHRAPFMGFDRNDVQLAPQTGSANRAFEKSRREVFSHLR